jgi:hypothetical protein
MMPEIIQNIVSALIGGGIAYGTMKAEIKAIKEQIAEHKLYGERLAAIEAKIDFIINNFSKK